MGIVFDISHYMLEDGPGIRTNVFLKGCYLRCKWCSNAYGLEHRIQLSYDPAKCIGCGRCYVSCYDGGHQAINWKDEERRPELNTDNCVGCHLCQKVCPVPDCIRPGEVVFDEGAKHETITYKTKFE